MRKLSFVPFLLALLSALPGCGDDGAAGDGDAGGEPDAGDAGEDSGSTEEEIWAERVDGFWGPAPALEDRVDIFEQTWTYLSYHQASFVTSDIDWDLVYETTRPRIEAAESWGRFYQLMADMFFQLQDAHSYFDSLKTCHGDEGFLAGRPPIFRQGWNIDTEFPLGVCVTLTDDGQLLVYRVDPDNPAGLEPGDVVLGYDGVPWAELVDRIYGWRIPYCGRVSSAPYSKHYREMISVVQNAHLFDRMDVLKHGATEPESIPTADLLSYSSDVICTDQLPVDGVEMPYQAASEVDLADTSDGTTWGILPSTNIGYVYNASLYPGAEEPITQAITDLMGTDALILDFRFNSGGSVENFYGAWSLIYQDDLENVLLSFIRSDIEDYTAMVQEVGGNTISIDADPETSYTNPIAILVGPKSNSYGEMIPWIMRQTLPNVRTFGRTTNGAFGCILTIYDQTNDFGLGDLLAKYTPKVMADPADGSYLNSEDWEPDEEVWIGVEDAIDGVDPVVKAALDWIASRER